MAKPHKSELETIVGQFSGKSADEIAELVRKRGIRGRMGTTSKCPMALLFGGEATGRYVIGRKYIARQSGKVVEKVSTPREVAVFVRKFDLGHYPGLIAPPPRCLRNDGSPPRKTRASGPSGKKRKPIEHHVAKLVGRFAE